MNKALRFWQGFKSVPIGFKLLFTGPKLWPYALVPALVSSGLFVLGFVLGYDFFILKMTGWAAALSGWWVGALELLLTIIGTVLFIVILLFLVLALSKIVLIPFLSVIAEKTIAYKNLLPGENFTVRAWVSRTLRQLRTTLVQLVFFGILGFVLFLVSFVPGLNVLVGILGVLVVAFDCSDYSLELAGLSFREKLSVFVNHLPEMLGLSLALGLTFWIPFLNLFLLPVAVAGSSHLITSFTEIWKTNG